ncbi:NosR/NirI family protein [Enterovibrio sp. ZSDZ35]|uniref:NosR/NirI family protein n=1 Tax=Enterovibrio qingdaonensis TaxID=2899818 RepID=A0ABT5QKR0_9GAMM|nr:NosR/NirI family protein [Enterovibrio sp. ZSDZ35]MDD1781570.1 NosR/NirI family protein [Enterovibrio sp. ZSDZ35]
MQWRSTWLLWILLMLLPFFVSAEWLELSEEAESLFPSATRMKASSDHLPITEVYQLDQPIGYVFETDDLTDFPGFSGETINLRVGLDTEGRIVGLAVLRHHEPIFLHGLGEGALTDFIDQYQGLSLKQQVFVGSNQQRIASDKVTYFDGVTKATVSVLVVHDTILSAARKVAQTRLTGFGSATKARLNTELYTQKTLNELLLDGALLQWTLSDEQAAILFDRDLNLLRDARDDENNDWPFIDLSVAVLNSPTIGVNVLGEAEYLRIMEALAPGDIAVLVGSSGGYQLVADDFVRGSTPARFSLMQDGSPLVLRDSDLFHIAPPSFASPLLDFDQVYIFTFSDQSGFDPAEPITVGMRVQLKKNFLEFESVEAATQYVLPEHLLVAVEPPKPPLPLWQRLWIDRQLEIAILGVYLLALTAIFTFQHRLSAYGHYLHPVRWGALAFVVLFIGFYAQGQLSVVNIYTFLLSLWQGFDITVFLLDPILFVLWIYVFVSLFLWGRGLFCGWLCPFGAMQEAVAVLAEKLRIRQWQINETLHSRLIYLKYVILLVLVSTAFYSLSLAETMAEVEPFKTAVTLVFDRSIPFVAYAVLLLVLSARVHKAYCRYLCPLGAGLAVLGRFRLFSWLTRRKECGSPCRLCEKSCGIHAIAKSGEIDYNECIQCMECAVIITDKNRCVAERYGKRNRSVSKIKTVDVTG